MPYEARVMGCLIEKEIAAPDQYPLSLNALVNACNQKSSRDPLEAALANLMRRGDGPKPSSSFAIRPTGR